MKKPKIFSMEVGDKTLSVEFNDWAEHANGTCLVTYGETVVLATAVQSKSAREGIDFFPLTVDYEEKFYAAGKILGSRFMRREGKASDEAILVSRLIDRSIRPLFSQKIRNEVQVIVLALSIDENNDPDIPAIIAASLALGTSDIRWAGPIGAVRIGKIGNEFVINPSYPERESGLLDTVICGKDSVINMIEAGAQEISEDDMGRAMDFAIAEIDKICKFQNDIIKEIGVAKRDVELAEAPQEMKSEFSKTFTSRVEEAVYIKEKMQRYEHLNLLRREWASIAAEQFPHVHRTIADGLFEETVDEIVHKNIIDHERRPDGRGVKELRTIVAKAKILPRTHGSGLFYRGETHVLSAVTLGAPSDVQLIEGMEVRAKKRFMHHYNFPPFSVGEIKAMRGPGRREIGHGALAERSLIGIIPDYAVFPYTIRVVSETLSSNGSSSMGSVCGSVLALMDAGVPIKAPVAGIAMGLMLSEAKSASGGMPQYKILTDIQGPEDHHGDMDFKVAGSRAGITGVQMDVKVDGIPLSIMKEAFEQAREARLQILDVMQKEIAEPRKELSKYAPRIITMNIHPDKIRDVIGPGGKVINSLMALTGASIDIEQDGSIFITAPSEEQARATEAEIKAITKEFEVGEVLMGKVTRIFPFGAMVEIAPKQEGLVHISELSDFRVNQVTDVIALGDEIAVQVKEIDDQGRINLSAKAVKSLELKPMADRIAPGAPRPPHQNHDRRDHGPRRDHRR